jgi:hypothetical protein
MLSSLSLSAEARRAKEEGCPHKEHAEARTTNKRKRLTAESTTKGMLSSLSLSAEARRAKEEGCPHEEHAEAWTTNKRKRLTQDALLSANKKKSCLT